MKNRTLSTIAIFFAAVISIIMSGGDVFAQRPPTGCPTVSITTGTGRNSLDTAIHCGDPLDLFANVIVTAPSANSYRVSSIPYNPPFRYDEGTQLHGFNDDYYISILNLPFKFCFFDSTYSAICVGSNGIISFDTTNSGNYCNALFDTFPSIPHPHFPYHARNAIYGVYEDIYPNYSPRPGDTLGKIYMGVMGQFPCRTAYISFDSCPLFGNYSMLNTYQIVLYEGTNIIDVYIKDRNCCSSSNSGFGLVGIQNEAGTIGISPPGRSSGRWTAHNEAWRFTPTGAPLYTVTWYQGTDTSSRGIVVRRDTIRSDTAVSVLRIQPPEGVYTYTARMKYAACNGEEFDLCDVRTITSIQYPVYTDTSICATGSYNFYGKTLRQNGRYADTIKNRLACDSAIHRLTLGLTTYYTDNQSACDSYTWVDGNTYTRSTSAPVFMTTNSVGCDSVMRLNLIIHPIYWDTVYDTTCRSLTRYTKDGFRNIDVSRTGDFLIDSLFHTRNGCDSIVQLRLHVNPVYDTTVYDTTCQNRQVRYNSVYRAFRNIDVSQSGNRTHTLTFTSSDGCDSTVHLHLHVNPIHEIHLYDTVCQDSASLHHYRIFHNLSKANAGIFTYDTTLATVNGCDSTIYLHLCVNPVYERTFRESACQNSRIPYNSANAPFSGIDISRTGTFSFDTTLRTLRGCDSIIHLILTVNAIRDTSIYDTTCQNTTRYTYLGFRNLDISTPREFAIDSVFRTSSGCDSVVHLHLKVNPVYSVQFNDTVCQNRQRLYDSPVASIFTNIDVSQAGDFVFDSIYHTTLGCDSVIRLNLRVNPVYEQTFHETTCQDSSSTYNSAYTFFSNIDISDTGYFTFDTTLASRSGCDSTIHLILRVNKTYDTTIHHTVCQSVTRINYMGFTRLDISSAGDFTYLRRLQTTDGCDSSVHLHLKVFPTYDTTIRDTVCQNSPPYSGYGFTNISTSATGIHNSTRQLQTANGCDSMVHLRLLVTPVYSVTFNESTCQNRNTVYNSVHTHFRGLNASIPGNYVFTDTLRTIRNCDSIVTLRLRVYPVYDTTVYDTTCQSTVRYNSYGFKNLNVSRAGDTVISRTFSASGGCDSTVHLHLKIFPSVTTTIYDTVCKSTVPYSGHGFSNINISTSGNKTFTMNLRTVHGCDSTVRLRLRVNQTYSRSFNESTCQDSVNLYNSSSTHFRGIDVSRAGIVNLTDTLHTTGGCDSIIKLKLTVNPIRENTIYYSTCQRSNTINYLGFRNLDISRAGDYVFDNMFRTKNGCDSLVHLHLTVYPTRDTTVFDTTCQSSARYSTYGFTNLSVSSAGNFTYNKTFRTSNGCDSVVHLQLHVNPVYNLHVYDTVCQHPTNRHSFLGFRNINISRSGNFTLDSTFRTIHGCDSIVHLHLRINPIYEKNIYRSVCRDTTSLYDTLGFRGIDISRTGNFIIDSTFRTINGCDSVVHLHLTVNQIYDTTIYDTVCQNTKPYNLLGFKKLNISRPGDYTIDSTFRTMHGCDSIVHLLLKVHPIYHDTVYDTICQDTALYNSIHPLFAGIDISRAKDTILDTVLHTADGCDSTIHLKLKIAPKYYINYHDTVCQSIGSRYNNGNFNNIDLSVASRIDIDSSYISRYGCDSTVHLHLVIFPMVDTNIVDTTCQSITPYTKDGFRNIDVSRSGWHNIDSVFSTQYYCDSVVHYRLLVNPVYSDTLYDTTCQNNRVPYNSIHAAFTGLNVSHAGTSYHTITYSTMGGCDSLVTLQLFVDYIFDTIIYDTVCQNSTQRYNRFGFHGTDISRAGLKIADSLFFTKKNGCDSVVHLYLTVNPIYNHDVYANICQDSTPYTYFGFRNIDIRRVGTRTIDSTFRTAMGCDSTVHLHLRIDSTYDLAIYDTVCQHPTQRHSYLGFNGIDISRAGDLVIDSVFRTVHGCDSTVHLHLRVNATYDTTFLDTVCRNDSMAYTPLQVPVFRNIDISVAGNYRFDTTYASVSGCDSTVRLLLRVNPIFDTNFYDTVCQNLTVPHDYFGFRNIDVSRTGELRIDSLFHTSDGCDSVAHLYLKIYPIYDTTIYDTVCQHPTQKHSHLGFNGIDVSRAGDLVIDSVFRTMHGCDSTVHLHLRVNPIFSTTIYDTTCQDSVPFNSIHRDFRNINVSRAGLLNIDSTFMAANGCDSVVHLQIMVHPLYDTTVYDTTCQNRNAPYNSVYRAFRNINISHSGDYTFSSTFQSIEGCDSTVHLQLRVNPIYDTTVYDTACQSTALYNYFGFRGLNVSNIGNRQIDSTFMSMSGCDSVVHLHLTICPTYDVTVYDTTCQTSTALFNSRHAIFRNIDVSIAGTMRIDTVLQSIHRCDSTIHLVLKVNPIYDTTVYDTTCQHLTRTYNSVYRIFRNINVSQSGMLRIDTTLVTGNGCDSVVHLRLKVNPIYDTTVYDTACQSTSPYSYFGFRGLNVSQTGSFIIDSTFRSADGCDSTVHLHLKVNPIYEQTIRHTTCSDTMPYTYLGFRNINISQAGTYNIDSTFRTVHGCDSVVHLILKIDPAYDIDIFDTVCQNRTPGYRYTSLADSTFRNIDISRTGNIRIDTLFRTAIGCDSTVHLKLTVTPTYDTIVRDTACQSTIPYDYFGFRNLNVSVTGDFVIDSTFRTINSCDSVVHLHLHVNPVYDQTIRDTVCQHPSQTYTNGGFRNIGISVSGLHHIDSTFHTIHGCDSVVHLRLMVNPIYEITVYDTTCQSTAPYDYFGFRGLNVSRTGSFLIDSTFRTIHGCDSVVHLHLKVYPTYDEDLYDTVCQDRTLSYNDTAHGFRNISLARSGNMLASSVLHTIHGCDSIFRLHLFVKPSTDTTIYDTTCQSYVTRYTNYGFRNIRINYAGTISLTGTYHTSLGCDSIINLKLFVKPMSEIIVYDTVCQSSSSTYHQYGFQNVNISRTGTFKIDNTFTSANGCDSLIHLYLTVNPTYDTNIYDTVCRDTVLYNSSNSNFTGIDISHAGNFRYDTVFHTTEGCDSAYHLFLTVGEIHDTTVYDTACQNTNSYNNFGFVNMDVSTVGDFVFDSTFRTVLGCDSTVHLHLHVNPVYEHTFYDTVCQHPTNPYCYYGFRNLNVSSTGDFVIDSLFHTYRGCDSLVHLHLHVNPIYEHHVYDTVCQNRTVRYTHAGFRNLNISVAGVFQIDSTFRTIHGCDSVVHLHLKVNPIYDISVFDTVCQHPTQTHSYLGFRNIGISSAGDFRIDSTFRTIFSCDSVVHLHLHVNPIYEHHVYDTTCQHPTNLHNYQGFHNINISYAGIYVIDSTFRTIAGCDSLVHLHLRVNPVYEHHVYDTVCQHPSNRHSNAGFRNIVISTAGDFIIDSTFRTIHGCDSLVHLHLRVNPVYNHVFNETTCIDSTIRYHSTTTLFDNIDISSTGVFTFDTLLHSIHGCDSSVRLILRVGEIYEHTFYDTTCQNYTVPYTYYGFRNIDVSRDGYYEIDSLFRTIYNCDSLVHLKLTVHPIYYKDTVIDTICAGNVFYYNGRGYNQTGTYHQVFPTIHGCDSTITIMLHVNDTIREYYYDTVCTGGHIVVNGIFYNTAGTHRQLFKNAEGCDSLLMIELHVYNHPQISLADTAMYCPGGFATIEASSDYGNYITWTSYPTDTTLYGQEHNFTIHVAPSRATIYDADYDIQPYDCHSRKSIIVTLPEPIEARIYANPTEIPIDNLHVVFTDVSIGDITSQKWILPTRTETDRQVVHYYPTFEDDSVTATLIVFNRQKCSDTAMTVVPILKGDLWVPNVFTPKVDGDNTRFWVKGYNLHEYEIYIYNRAGLIVYHSDDITQPWDGTYQGQDCIEASYVYLIKYSFQYNPSRKLEKVGSILLLR